ncbi:MAG: hypothetical protein ACR2P8_03100 [Myxococcota bacterium]
MMRIALLLLAFALPITIGAPSLALVIEDGSANRTPPADDPGWDHVGRVVGSLNAVYLGHGWAATAKHVYLGSQAVTFRGETYPIVPGSDTAIVHYLNKDAELKVFRMYPYPRGLDVLPIATSVAADDEVMLIGLGRANAGPVGNPPTGYLWGSSGIKRWGTNHLGAEYSGIPVVSTVISTGTELTRSLFTQFDAGASAFEASVAGADSGGALFVSKSGGWELAGILWAVLSAVPEVASYDDDGLAADLTYAPYRDQVFAITRPCDDGEDNDLDGLTDLADPGCLDLGDLSEEPACSDGLDNDADGQVDTADGDCSDPDDLLEAIDGDGDLVEDIGDNCSETPNPDQLDTNLDGYGNACDADYNSDGIVGIPDFGILSGAYGSELGDPNYDPDTDADGDGTIGVPDFSLIGSTFNDPPGPSGLECAGTPPCF